MIIDVLIIYDTPMLFDAFINYIAVLAFFQLAIFAALI